MQYVRVGVFGRSPFRWLSLDGSLPGVSFVPWRHDIVQDIAKEVAGEVGTLVKGVHRSKLFRGVMGYLKRDEAIEDSPGHNGEQR